MNYRWDFSPLRHLIRRKLLEGPSPAHTFKISSIPACILASKWLFHCAADENGQLQKPLMCTSKRNKTANWSGGEVEWDFLAHQRSRSDERGKQVAQEWHWMAMSDLSSSLQQENG